MDYYDILGVPKTATESEIKQAYRKLAAQHHPDRGGDTAKFQQIQQAYDTLGNAENRSRYDNPGSQFHGFHGFNGFPGGNPFDDIINQFMRQSRQQMYTVTVFVTLEQVAQGAQETIQINTGQGPKLIKLQIPQGIDDGQTIRYEGIMPHGALHVCYRIREHTRFRRQGLDLISNESVDVFKLITGTKLEVTDIFGKKLEVNVARNTQPGIKLRIPQRGLKAAGQTGDHYILIMACLPDKIPEELFNTISKYYQG